jgi:hypothetical protein
MTVPVLNVVAVPPTNLAPVLSKTPSNATSAKTLPVKSLTQPVCRSAQAFVVPVRSNSGINSSSYS